MVWFLFVRYVEYLLEYRRLCRTMYSRAQYEPCDKHRLFHHKALTPLAFPMDTALPVSVVGTENLCKAIIYMNQTHLNIPSYSSDTWWETALRVPTAVWSTHPGVSVTGQLVSVLFLSALQQMLSWWPKSASHCTLLVQPSARLCSSFTFVFPCIIV